MKYFTDGIHEVEFKNKTAFKVLSQNMRYLKDRSEVIVVFSAAVSKRSLRKPPFFSGKGMAKDVKVPMISISDPSLEADDILSLGWYAGSSTNLELQHQIREFLNSLLASLSRIVLMGGSGGGFAALTQAFLLSNSKVNCLVWNPQTSISMYNPKYVNRYLNVCFNIFSNSEDSSVLYSKLDSTGCIHSLLSLEIPSAGRIVYLQNESDRHLQLHAVPFLKKFLGGYNFERSIITRKGDLQLDFICENFSEGHKPPTKEVIISYLTNFIGDDIIK